MKILLTADIHIDDKRHFNLFDDSLFRLNQYDKLAKRIIDIYEKNDCEAIIIAGDIINRATIRPYIIHAALRFLSYLSKHSKDVYYILGQHDFDISKYKESREKDTLVTAICSEFPNIHYMNKKSLMFGNKKFSFNNFEEEKPNWEWVRGSDVLISHLTVDEMFGQEYDNSVADLIFCGDIHQPKQVENAVCIGVPIQGNLGDSPSTCVVIYDSVSGSWERKPVIEKGEWDFLQLLRKVNGKLVTTPNESPLEEYIVVKEKDDSSDMVEVIHKSLDINKVIKGVVIGHGLGEIHDKYKNKVYLENADINATFIPKSIDISNFRSIDKFKYEFKDGLTLVNGLNGCFVGDTKVRLEDSSIVTMRELCKNEVRNFKVPSINSRGNLVYSIATSCWVSKLTKELVKVTLTTGDSYLCTPDHRWMLNNEKYIKASELKVYDLLKTFLTSNSAEVLSVEKVLLDKEVPVYDIEVPETNNFVIENGSDVGVFVHNSGKSSFLNSINFVLNGASSARKFVRRGETEFQVAFKFVYSGIDYEIIRGWKGNSGILNFYINGEESTSENKSVLSDYIKECLPWLSIFNLMYHEQTRSGFLSSYNYKDRVNLINKLIGLEVVQELNNLVKFDIAEINESIASLNNSRLIHENTISLFKDTDLSLIDSDFDEELKVLEKQKTLLSSLITVQEKITEQVNKKSGLKDILSQSVDIEEIKVEEITEEINGNNLLIHENSSKINKVTDSNTKIKTDISAINQSISISKSNLSLKTNELNSLSSDNCPMCNQVINQDKLSELRESITNNITLITDQLNSLEKDLSKSPELDGSSIKLLEELNETIREKVLSLNTKIQVYNNNITLVNSISSAREKSNFANEQIKELSRTVASLMNNITISEGMTIQEEKDRINEEIGNITAKRERIPELIKIRDNLKLSSDKLIQINNDIEEKTSELSFLTKYLSITSIKGDIIRSVLEKVSDHLSDDLIKVKAIKEALNGNISPDFSVDMKVYNSFIEYDLLSEGQKTVADMLLLEKLISMIGGVGIMIFDETFKFLDMENLNLIIERISHLDCRNILMVSHSYPEYDYFVKSSLTDGVTSYTIM